MSEPTATARAVLLMQQARTLQGGGRRAEALAAYETARTLLPDHLPLLVEYAQLARDSGQWAAAAALFRHIGALKPDSGFAGNLGYALFRQQDFAAAIPFLRAHLARTPDDLAILRALAAALAKISDWDAALVCTRDIARLDPSQPALDVVLNAHFYLGHGEELDACIDDVLQRYPDRPPIQAICGMHLLKRGEFARGFAIQRATHWGGESDLPRDADLAHLPDWDGQPFAGTLLVSGEQGLGEEILASRLFPALQASGQRCVITCEPRLLTLFRRSFPLLDFVAQGSPARAQLLVEKSPQRRIRSLDLADFFLAGTLAAPAAGWLQPDSARVQQIRDAYRARWPGQTLIGASWASRRRIHGAYGKSMPIAALAPLLTRADTTVVSCQYGDLATDFAELGAAGLPLPYCDPAINATADLDGLLAQLAALDAVITVSNTTAHLAGAAALPCRLLLPQREPVFWYWGYAGDRTPWYPSIRIFRNGASQDWQDTLMRALQSI